MVARREWFNLTNLTPSQQAMFDDGCPLACFEKTAPWEPSLIRSAPVFEKPKIDPAAEKLMVEIEEQKKLALVKSKKKSLPVVDRTRQRWDSRRNKWVSDDELLRKHLMISITTNTRGNTKMTTKAFKDMSMAELVDAYNKVSGKSPIKKFETRTLGLKRLEAMEVAGAIKEVKANKPVNTKAAKTSKPKEAKSEKTGILGEFGFRDDSPREKLLVAFNENMGKMVTMENLASQVLGSKSVDNVKMIKTLLAGITWRIKVSELAYEVKTEKEDGVVSLGLFKKK